MTCRVLKIARQPYYRWLASPVTDAELERGLPGQRACSTPTSDDPEFGYRFLVDEARDAGEPMAERTAWRICSDNGWWSAFGKKKAAARARSPGRRSTTTLVTARTFTAAGPEPSCGSAISPSTGPVRASSTSARSRTCYSNRIVGYSIDSRMKSRLAVTALNNAVARRDDVAGCIVHTDRGSQFRSRKFVRALSRHDMVGSMGRVGAAGDNAAMECFFCLLQKNVLNRRPGPPARSSGSRSSPGSNGPTTAAAGKTPSAD